MAPPKNVDDDTTTLDDSQTTQAHNRSVLLSHQLFLGVAVTVGSESVCTGAFVSGGSASASTSTVGFVSALYERYPRVLD
jgi:hypothetical protein